MNYTTIFDVTQAGFRGWIFAAPGLACLAGSATVLLLIKTGVLHEAPARKDRWGPRFIFIFVFLWGLFAVCRPLSDYLVAIHTMRNMKASVVEGIVTEFRPMPPEGHQDESFMVQGTRFAFSDYEISAGFNNSASHGGPIREGLPVRIWYSGKEILRLDIGAEDNNRQFSKK